jgi:hypothetical protein
MYPPARTGDVYQPVNVIEVCSRSIVYLYSGAMPVETTKTKGSSRNYELRLQRSRPDQLETLRFTEKRLSEENRAMLSTKIHATCLLFGMTAMV